jgi:hypothetical protein
VGHIQFFLNFSHSHPGITGPDQFPDNFQPGGIAQLTEKCGCHIIIKYHGFMINSARPDVNYIFRNIEILGFTIGCGRPYCPDVQGRLPVILSWNRWT